MKQGETLALNERIMLSLVSTGVSYTQCLHQQRFYFFLNTQHVFKNAIQYIAIWQCTESPPLTLSPCLLEWAS